MGQQRRLQLNELLVSIQGNRNVYFQPPENVTMKYPAIVYELDGLDSVFANNLAYRYTKRYQVTVIDQNPDSETPDKIARLPLCSFSRHFAADNLNHDVFSLHF